MTTAEKGSAKPCVCEPLEICENCSAREARDLVDELPRIPVDERPTPDDTAAPEPRYDTVYEEGVRALNDDDTVAPDFPPYTYGERRRNPYYQARRSVWLMMQGQAVETMIHGEADVTDVLQAFDVAVDLGSPVISYQLGEVVAKILRLGRKPGTNVRHEIIKCHEHLQAAEDAWVAEEREKCE